MRKKEKIYLVSFNTGTRLTMFEEEDIYTDYLIYATSLTNLYKKCKERGYSKSQVRLKTIL